MLTLPPRLRHALEYLIGGRSAFFSYVEICSFVAFAAIQPPTLRALAKSLIVTMADERSIQWRQWTDYDTRLAMTRNARGRDDPGRKRFTRGCRHRESGLPNSTGAR